MTKKILLRTLIILGNTMILIVLALYCIMWICVNGPSSRAKELFVMSVRETSAVKFLANIYCSADEIKEIEQKKNIDVTDFVDTSLINIDDEDETEHSIDDDKNNEDNENIDNNENIIIQEDGIIVEKVYGSTFKGYMMSVKDPSRVMVGTSSNSYSSNVAGRKISEMIESYGAVAATNAGGFDDPNGIGNGGIPIGIVISEGELKYGSRNQKYNVIGINNENVLIVGNMTGQQAIDSGIRDAVSFGPILVINGQATEASQSGGLNPRTAIGQKADGTILLLVIDGRQSSSFGASYEDIADVMLRFGAVNAANLDGGSSSMMFYKGELLNSCASLSGPRNMPTCILVK